MAIVYNVCLLSENKDFLLEICIHVGFESACANFRSDM